MSDSDNHSTRPLANKRLSRSGEAAMKKATIKVRKATGSRTSVKSTAAKPGSVKHAALDSVPDRRSNKNRKPMTLHPRNVHHGRYDMEILSRTLPELGDYLEPNPKGEPTIDFANPNAVLCLNQALLKHCYGIDDWQIPAGYLCPPIPGRADYIHYAADLLKKYHMDQAPVRVLDVGAGANLIYSLIANRVYQWQMVACDIDAQALKSAQVIIDRNNLHADIECRRQPSANNIFRQIIQPGEFYALTVCNPPFYQSAAEASAENARKVRNLSRHQQQRNTDRKLVETQPLTASFDPWGKAKARADEQRNFGGQHNELWCDGGEIAFLQRMVQESKQFSNQVGWFTSLVSKQENMPLLLTYLKRQGVKKTEVVKMAQGQKISRFIAWCF